ncbi:hypothetical protein AKJ09_08714 [Labilithrix luteola]|uniref:Lipoprotein n=1 Tax=Labilithrix luteola TaxID=1391654 RepID=A0A0K1Q8B2_9BACT|nr:hypothetical protein [Labilithrix luteola]AKV02051.1 hypothetical protein AKJ09_08714 [Labilithrix luteola]
MRSSSVVFFGVLGLVALSACSVSTTDNSITFKTKREYVDSSQPAKSSTSEWNGQAITINNDGVNPLVGNGGVEIYPDPSATKVTAQAIFAGRGDVEADAQESIRDALATFQVTESNGNITVTCKHGGDHGSSPGGQSGCKLLKVTIPAGTAAVPVKLTVGDGNGGIRFNGAVTVSSLIVDENGSGDVSVKVNPVKGASVVVTGEDAVSVAVPSTFSAESVILTVDESDPAAAAERIITTAFPGMKSNQPYPIAGATADAAKTLNVQSKGILSSDTVTIASY